MSVLWCDIFYPLCELSEHTVVGTALSPTLTMSMPANGPVSFRCFHQATSTDPRKSGPRIAINHVSGPKLGTLEIA